MKKDYETTMYRVGVLQTMFGEQRIGMAVVYNGQDVVFVPTVGISFYPYSEPL